MDELSTEDQVSPGSDKSHSNVLVVSGALDGPEVVLRLIRIGAELTIGRASAEARGDAWRIQDSTISRRHARIVREARSIYLEDMGSRNGTWLDGTVLRGERRLLSGGMLIILGEVGVFRQLTAAQMAAVQIDQQQPLGPVPTASGTLALALRRMRILAPTSRPLLLAGETGTGKEVYARAIHGLSGRKGSFVAVNCASFNRDLLESHLFGYKRGSHSLAYEDNPGILSTAEGGTLFLDEIGEMDPILQTKFLRFLQDRTFFGLGATRARKAEVRIIAATQSPADTLRKDILGRLGAEPLVLPALRNRKEDLPALCRYFLRCLPKELGIQGFEREVACSICDYDWPKNIRELEASLSEAALSAAERGVPRISASDLPKGMGRAPHSLTSASDSKRAPVSDRQAAPPRRQRRPAPEVLKTLLRDHAGEVPAVARYLQRNRELVWRWCRLDGLDPSQFKNELAPPRTPARLTGSLPHDRGRRSRHRPP